MEEEERIFQKVDSVVRQDGRSTYIGEDDLVRLTQRGITIDFHLKHEKLDMITVFRVIKRTQKLVAEKLGYDLQGIKVNIYRSGAEVLKERGRLNPYGAWAAGFFDGEVTIVSEEDDDTGAFAIFLTHELIHCAVHRVAGGRCPFWLDEGLSIYLSQELPDLYLEALAEAVDGERPLLTLEELEAPDQSVLEDEGSRRLAYAEAACIVESLVVSPSHGWERVRGLLSGLGRGNMARVLFDHCLSYDLIQSDMERWARKKVWELFPADRRR